MVHRSIIGTVERARARIRELCDSRGTVLGIKGGCRRR